MLHRVLVVDDDRDTAELVRLHLADLGCDVRLAHDGAAGLALAQRERFAPNSTACSGWSWVPTTT
jgi:DNA-binding response OmpR family regulator